MTNIDIDFNIKRHSLQFKKHSFKADFMKYFNNRKRFLFKEINFSSNLLHEFDNRLDLQ